LRRIQWRFSEGFEKDPAEILGASNGGFGWTLRKIQWVFGRILRRIRWRVLEYLEEDLKEVFGGS